MEGFRWKVAKKIKDFFRKGDSGSVGMGKESGSSSGTDLVLVLDFGGQYAHLIGRRIREQKVYSKIVPGDIDSKRLRDLNNGYKLKGIVLSGGPSSVYEDGAPKLDLKILDMGLPILAICYGHQLLAQMVGGTVELAEEGEYGVVRPEILTGKGILKGIGGRVKGWTSHRDVVRELPPDYRIMARTENCPIAAFGNEERGIYGIQWHPEVTHSEYGDQVFRNFLFDICKCEPSWEMKEFVDKTIDDMRRQVGDSKSIVAVSGGVDSTTAAVLASKALKENLKAVFVDNGLLREGEPEQVEKTLKGYDLDLIVLDERDRFFESLNGVVDPEDKRKVVGEEFIRVFEEVAEDEAADYLIQGTIYPDWIESGSEAHSEKIKTHHNVGGLPSRVNFKGVVEPFRDLYKDEVREVAESLGLPREIVRRQPFPGPGLAVRVTREVTREKVKILKRADMMLREEVEKATYNDDLWQYFSVLLSTKSTGVKGDARDYGYIVALRVVESKEAMTANFAKLPYDFLERVSKRITNEIPEVTRVVYDITHKPPATIEWE